MCRDLSLPLLVVVAVLCGCATRQRGEVAPRGVLDEYARALRDGDLRRAYGLMTPEYQRRHSLATFSRRIRKHPGHVQRATEQLLAKGSAVELRARVPLDAVDALELIYRDGRWWIATNPLDLYRQDTPRQALRSFVRAVEHRRYDIALRLAPSRWARKLTPSKIKQSWDGPKKAEMEQLLANLKRNLNQPISYEHEDRAIMPYGDRHAVRFVRENGLWKIDDPD